MASVWFLVVVLAIAIATSKPALAANDDFTESREQAVAVDQAGTTPKSMIAAEDDFLEFNQQAVAEDDYNQAAVTEDVFGNQFIAEDQEVRDDGQQAVAAGFNSLYGLNYAYPGKSCKDIYDKNPSTHGRSGNYEIRTNRVFTAYCDMVLECGGQKGWMRVASVNPRYGCPTGWKRITSPTAACRPPSDNSGCFSAHFYSHGLAYNRVCGMVVGYQKGTTDGFASFVSKTSINDPYLDGVSITYGTPRKHIWSYAAGVSESYGPNQYATCPCSLYRGAPPPAFVRDNYYCESGNTGGLNGGAYYTSDPLWDGKGCSNNNGCCAQPNLPWFYRQIPLTSGKDLEARICYDQDFGDEAVLVKELRLFVQ